MTCRSDYLFPYSTGVQTESAVCSVSTQTDITLPCMYVDWFPGLESSDEEMTCDHADDDSDYAPSDASSDNPAADVPEYDKMSAPEPQQPQGPNHNVFLVFWTCLVQLLTTWCSCPSCGNRKISWICQEVGTLLHVQLQCTECAHTSVWSSQPLFGRTPAGNICLSAAILFAGATATKVLRVLSHMGVAVMSLRSFFRHQERVLFTAVKRVWRVRQVWMLSLLQAEGDGVVCGGDGRADSPGHCAKYGTYTMMELRKKAVIDLQLVQVITDRIDIS